MFYQYFLMVKMVFYFTYLHLSLKNQTLKYSTYIHETKKKIGKSITIYTGSTIKYKDLEHIQNRSDLTKYLKKLTYSLRNMNLAKNK